jgi:hypothetical protein
MLLFSPAATGPFSTVRRSPKCVPRSSEKRVTAPSELTYRLCPTQTSPSGPFGPATTRTGCAPRRAIRNTPSPPCDVAPDAVAHSRPRASNANAETCLIPRA